MKVLFIGYSEKETRLINFLKENGCEVEWTDKPLDKDLVSSAELIVSYGYKFIIKNEVLSAAKRPILNLHISYLPFNRGAHPNFWAFFEGTPHGVSIHEVNTGVDTGDLVAQAEISLNDLSKTFEETYVFLRDQIEQLFINNWPAIKTGNYEATVQDKIGTSHKVSELPDFTGGWGSKVVDALSELSTPMGLQEMVLGTVQLGLSYGINNKAGQPSPKEAFSILETAQSLGLKFVDTSDLYGSSSQLIGEFGAERFSVLTKFKLEERESFTSQLQKSLMTLKTDKIHCYSFHRFSDFENFEFWDEVDEAKASGKIQQLGISVYDNSQLERAVKCRTIDLIQLPFNPLDNYVLRGRLLAIAKSNHKKIHIRSIYLQGLILMGESEFALSLRPLINPIAELKKIAARAGCSLQQLCWAYAKSFNTIDGIVVGVDSVQQLRENLMLSKTPPLPKEILGEIHRIQVESPELLNPANWSKK